MSWTPKIRQSLWKPLATCLVVGVHWTMSYLLLCAIELVTVVIVVISVVAIAFYNNTRTLSDVIVHSGVGCGVGVLLGLGYVCALQPNHVSDEEPLIWIVHSCVAAPLLEELLYREVLFRLWRNDGAGKAVAIIALAFVSGHYLVGASAAYVIAILVGGVSFSIVRLRRSLLAAMIAHVACNATVTAFVLV